MALILLTHFMSKITIISRRLFVLALGASGACHAAKPLIDFDMSHGALIDFDQNGSLFGNPTPATIPKNLTTNDDDDLFMTSTVCKSRLEIFLLK